MTSAVRRNELRFDVIREPWNEYELPDGSILRVKHVLLRIFRIEEPEGRISWETDVRSNVVLSHVPEGSKGPPSSVTYSHEQLRSQIVEHDVDYKTLSEEWNEYVLEDGTKIRIKFTVTRISKTDKFDRRGEPIYVVEHAMIPRVILPRRP